MLYKIPCTLMPTLKLWVGIAETPEKESLFCERRMLGDGFNVYLASCRAKSVCRIGYPSQNNVGSLIAISSYYLCRSCVDELYPGLYANVLASILQTALAFSSEVILDESFYRILNDNFPFDCPSLIEEGFSSESLCHYDKSSAGVFLYRRVVFGKPILQRLSYRHAFFKYREWYLKGREKGFAVSEETILSMFDEIARYWPEWKITQKEEFVDRVRPYLPSPDALDADDQLEKAVARAAEAVLSSASTRAWADPKFAREQREAARRHREWILFGKK